MTVTKYDVECVFVDRESADEAVVDKLVAHYVTNVNVTTYVDESNLVSRSKKLLKSKNSNEAAVAQLVEHHVANVNVTSSSLVSRSNI